MQGMNGMDGMLAGWGPIMMVVWLLVLLLVLALAVYGLARLLQDLTAPPRTGRSGRVVKAPA